MPKPAFWTTGTALALVLGALGYHLYTEPEGPRFWFAAGVTASIFAALTLMTRRALFAGFVTVFLVAFIHVVSQVKLQTMGMGLHAYDLFFYVNAQTTGFLWSEYRSHLMLALIALVLAVALAAVIWRLETTRYPRSLSVLVLAVAAAVAAWSAGPAYAQRRPASVFGVPHPISAFYLSWGETARALGAGLFIEAAAQTGGGRFAEMAACRMPDRRPLNVVLIHQESLMPPSLFPSLSYDRGLDPFFISDDGQLHKLHVETHGGGSWLTDFSLLVGVSTKSFGRMRDFLHVFLRNKLRNTLPQVFEECGYRNFLFFPMYDNFLALGRFYRTIGFDRIFDSNAQHAPSGRERDRHYFTNALDAMGQEFKTSDRPVFVYVQTMAGHGPYSFKYMPDETVPAGGPGTPADMNEFLRRLAMAKIDYDFLIAEIKRRFPDKRFLIVRYGDHQPTATRSLLGVPPDTEITEANAPAGFVTFYAATGLNYTVPALPHYDALDIAFLGTVTLEAAGFPLPAAYQERKRLMALCAGRYYGCKKNDEILAFHRRLIDSGIIDAQ